MVVPHFKPVSSTVEEQADLPLNNYEAHNSRAQEQGLTWNATDQYACYNYHPDLEADEETKSNSQDEYVVPDEIITTSNNVQEEEYVVNEPFYEDYQENDHGEEVYEDMETVQNIDYEELAVHWTMIYS